MEHVDRRLPTLELAGEPDEHGNPTVSVKEASRLLGITPRGVRQRISRGRLNAVRVDGDWLVYLPEQERRFRSENPMRNTIVDEERTGENTENGTVPSRAPVPPPVAVPSSQDQLNAVMTQWLQPLVEKIGELERDRGRLEAELERFRREDESARERERELGRMQEQLAQAQRENQYLAEALEHISKPEPEERPRRFFARLLGI